MCGRYAASRSAADMMLEYEAEPDSRADTQDDSRSNTESTAPEANYNVTPTSDVAVVRTRTRDGARVLSTVRWGLLPHFAKDLKSGSRFINARAETVATQSAFRTAFARRRCLVPADGWFEWLPREPDGPREVRFMHPADGGGLTFAGLWAVWSGPDGPVLSCTIVTTAAVGALTEVHDRMPLTLPRERWSAWLDPATAEPEGLLAPSEDLVGGIDIRRVGPEVGNVRATGPGLVAEQPDPQAAPVTTLF